MEHEVKTTFDRVGGALTVHQRALGAQKNKIISVERRAAERIAKLELALAEEKARADALEARANEVYREKRDADRLAARDVQRVEESVEALDRAVAHTIRKSLAPRESRQTLVRDERGRVTEVISIEAGRPTATVKRFVRDAQFRIVAAETYEVAIEDETC